MGGREKLRPVQATLDAKRERRSTNERAPCPAQTTIYRSHVDFIVDLILDRSQTVYQSFLGQDRFHMPVELLVILGAEASILGYVAAMTLHAKRMDVLNGRSFEQPIVSPERNKHLPWSLPRKARDHLLRLSRRWRDLIAYVPPDLLRHVDITRMRRRILRARLRTPFRFETSFRRPRKPAADGSGPPVLSEASRKTGAQGRRL